MHHGDHADDARDEAQAAAREVEQVPAAQQVAQAPRLGLVGAVGHLVQAGVCVAHDEDGKGHDGDDKGGGGGVAAPDGARAVGVVGRVAVGDRHGGRDLGHQGRAAAVELPPGLGRRLGHVDGRGDAHEGCRGNGAWKGGLSAYEVAGDGKQRG